jgi:hypothetical protein
MYFLNFKKYGFILLRLLQPPSYRRRRRQQPRRQVVKTLLVKILHVTFSHFHPTTIARVLIRIWVDCHLFKCVKKLVNNAKKFLKSIDI